METAFPFFELSVMIVGHTKKRFEGICGDGCGDTNIVEKDGDS